MPSFTLTLAWWQWGLIALVPPAILFLYFLKLKRKPIEVPSTYLWHKSIEDLHVNSLFQRLKNNLLLILQLLVVLLAMLALARPSWQGTDLAGERFVFLIDNSASMSATDIAPTRLDQAKREVAQMIDALPSGAAAMILSFSDVARVEQTWTVNRYELHRRLNLIQPTERPTDLLEALNVAAGLANPGRMGAAGTSDVQVADALPATLYILSDGRSPVPEKFSLGNLEPMYIPIGKQGAEATGNVGILSFSTRRNEENKTKLQAFGRVGNFGPKAVTLDLSLYADGDKSPIDAKSVTLDAYNREKDEPGVVAVAFELEDFDSGILELRAEHKDVLPVDNRAWACVNPPHPTKVLVVSGVNKPLSEVLQTERARQLADVTWVEPDYLLTDDYKKAARGGTYHLIIFDGCVPEQMPEANTFFMGAIPPASKTAKAGAKADPKEADPKADPKAADPKEAPKGADPKEETKELAGRETAWSHGEVKEGPVIVDIDRSHPLLNLVEMGDVRINKTLTDLKYPAGGATLVYSHRDIGPLLAIAPREGYQDAVLGFRLMHDGTPNTDWWVKLSFPNFFLNLLSYLGGSNDPLVATVVRPGQTLALRGQAGGDKVLVQRTMPPPAAEADEVLRSNRNTFDYAGADRTGIYQVQWGMRDPQFFAVNLFDAGESDILPRAELKIGDSEPVQAQGAREAARQEAWKWLLILGLLLLLAEWWIYNRRVAL